MNEKMDLYIEDLAEIKGYSSRKWSSRVLTYALLPICICVPDRETLWIGVLLTG